MGPRSGGGLEKTAIVADDDGQQINLGRDGCYRDGLMPVRRHSVEVDSPIPHETNRTDVRRAERVDALGMVLDNIPGGMEFSVHAHKDA